MNFSKKNENGYIALMSAIVISALLVTLTFTLSFAGFFLRFNILDSGFKSRSFALAEACVDQALNKLAADPFYPGGQSITVGTESCSIGSVTPGAQFSFKTQGVYPSGPGQPEKSYSNISVVVNSADMSVVSWDETAN